MIKLPSGRLVATENVVYVSNIYDTIDEDYPKAIRIIYTHKTNLELQYKREDEAQLDRDFLEKHLITE